MALLLHIETAGQTSSVAVSENGVLTGLAERNEKNLHASVITLLIEAAMKEAEKSYSQLDAVSVSMGPGSYTGLRIGVATAKGLCYALNIPLVGINTLDVMATGLIEQLSASLPGLYPEEFTATLSRLQDFSLCPMIDARRMEVYLSIYSQEGITIKETAAVIIDPDTFSAELASGPVLFFGDGSDKISGMYDTEKNALFVPGFLTSAAFQVSGACKRFTAGEFENLYTFEPFYLKEFFTVAPAAAAPATPAAAKVDPATPAAVTQAAPATPVAATQAAPATPVAAKADPATQAAPATPAAVTQAAPAPKA